VAPERNREMHVSSGTDLRRNPGLELVVVDGSLQLCDHEGRRSFELAGSWGLLPLLIRCAGWQRREQVVGYVRDLLGLEADAATSTIERLLSSGLLIERSSDVLEEERSALWARHGWAAAHRFQRHTELLLKIDWAAPGALRRDVDLMRRYVAAEPQPATYKAAASDLSIDLPLDRAAFGGLGAALHGDAPPATSGRVDCKGLSTYLYFGFGQTGTKQLPVTGLHVTKTTPSGGSRHPTEAYVFAVEVEGVPPGIYHYNVQHHRLDRLKRGPFATELRKDVIIHDDRPGFAPRFGLVLTSVVERSMFRYRESRSYRVVHHDVGHLLQTAALLAHGLGWRCYRGYTMRDRAIEDLLGVDRLREPAIAYAVVG
jgi:SagB-type dehydrogenase family enzyme